MADGRAKLTQENRNNLRDIGIYEDLDEIFRAMAVQRQDFTVTGLAPGFGEQSSLQLRVS